MKGKEVLTGGISREVENGVGCRVKRQRKGKRAVSWKTWEEKEGSYEEVAMGGLGPADAGQVHCSVQYQGPVGLSAGTI